MAKRPLADDDLRFDALGEIEYDRGVDIVIVAVAAGDILGTGVVVDDYRFDSIARRAKHHDFANSGPFASFEKRTDLGCC